jgi:ribosomal protein S17E
MPYSARRFVFKRESNAVEKTIEIQFKELREKIAGDISSACITKEHSVHIDWQTKDRLVCNLCQEICDIIVNGVPYEKI